MARRAIAVIAACLFTVPTGASEASPARDDAAGPRARGVAAPCAPAAGDPHPANHPGTARAGRPGEPPGVRGYEPHAPSPAEVARLLTEVPEHASGAQPPGPIRTWVHVITDGPQYVSRQDVIDQIAVLNDAYGGRLGGVDTAIRFRLEGITTTVQPAWFRDAIGNEVAMKTRLHRGGPETLNLYITQLDNLILGYSTYPHAYDSEPMLDGVVIDWRSMPGGSMRNFDRGYTAVHEIGHWLGLLHTFENGCAEPGDGVADTPPEARPSQGCPHGKDTCPAPGVDPIHNFMDYSYDLCMTEFTRGQANRMHAAWNTYREEKSQYS